MLRVFSSLIITSGLLVVSSTPAFAQDVNQLASQLGSPIENMDGLGRMGGCSGAAIELNDSQGGDKALFLTNGHCCEFTRKKSEKNLEYMSNTDVRASIHLFDLENKDHAFLAENVLLGTSHDSDVCLLRMNVRFQELDRLGIHPFSLSSSMASPGQQITIASGYYRRQQSCSIDAIIPELKHGNLQTKNAYQYHGCSSLPGWSGSPMIDSETRKIVGVNNDHAQPDVYFVAQEIYPSTTGGPVMIHIGEIGTSYGQQTAPLLDCLRNQRFDISQSACEFHDLTGKN